MIAYITEAAKNFSKHQLEVDSDETELPTNVRTLIAYIDIEDSHSRKVRVYLACEVSLVQQIANLYLFEEQSDDETLQEMMLEVTNMIVGSAKVLSEEEGTNPFVIATPHLVVESFDTLEYDEIRSLHIDGKRLTIALKEL